MVEIVKIFYSNKIRYFNWEQQAGIRPRVNTEGLPFVELRNFFSTEFGDRFVRIILQKRYAIILAHVPSSALLQHRGTHFFVTPGKISHDWSEGSGDVGRSLDDAIAVNLHVAHRASIRAELNATFIANNVPQTHQYAIFGGLQPEPSKSLRIADDR